MKVRDGLNKSKTRPVPEAFTASLHENSGTHNSWIITTSHGMVGSRFLPPEPLSPFIPARVVAHIFSGSICKDGATYLIDKQRRKLP